ncbi:MAG TPA: SDR family oxidoreductase [Symbiobacteriaceae bacterium]|nr:SDR family oxidoreductase [Symbiobacteriaceae bacterium]
MKEKIVLITGCSTGIGRATAIRLAAAGYTVIATARRPEAIADLPAARKLALDVERADSVAAAVDAVISEFGRIDILINNAGYGQLGALEEVSEELLHRVFEVNVHGPMRLVRAVAPHMRRQGSGRIVNLSSVAGRLSIPMMGAYCGTKFAVEAMSDALRGELSLFGIQVVLIEPGAIRTEFENTARSQAGSIMGQTDSPYRKLYQAAQQMLSGSNTNAPGPEAVAQVIQRALEAPRPRARYQVPFSAVLAARGAALVPDRLFDWLLRKAMHRMAR